LNDLYGAALNYVAVNPPEARSDEVLQAVLYGSALDNEDGHLAEEICRRRPAMLVALAGSGLARGEPDAKWQPAEQLGRFGHDSTRSNDCCLILARDEHEFVRRRVLGALARAGSPAVERVTLDASPGRTSIRNGRG
jgi:hypothetical protein